MEKHLVDKTVQIFDTCGSHGALRSMSMGLRMMWWAQWQV